MMIYELFLSHKILREQSGHLDVVVPPDILNSIETSADESVTNEGGNVQLLCKATGVPEPRLEMHLIQLTSGDDTDIFNFSIACNGDVRMAEIL